MNEQIRMPANPQIELRCHTDSSMLGLLREFVCSVARHHGFSEKQVAEIEISVDEACANAMEHAYNQSNSDGDRTEVLVEMSYTGDEMTVRIIDRGAGNPIAGIIEYDSLQNYLDAAREKYRGLGILLMQKFMDRVDIKSVPGTGTTVEMTKFRR